MVGDFEINTSDLEDLSYGLEEASQLVKIELDTEVARIGVRIFAESKAEAAKHSKSIPPTMKLVMVPGTWMITAGSKEVQLAALYELGNRFRGGFQSPTFIHPVFGEWEPGTPPQRRHPFIAPVMAANAKSIMNKIYGAWDKATRSLKLRKVA